MLVFSDVLIVVLILFPEGCMSDCIYSYMFILIPLLLLISNYFSISIFRALVYVEHWECLTHSSNDEHTQLLVI